MNAAGGCATPSPPPRAAAAPRPPRSLSILHLITRLDRGGSSDCTLWQAWGAARRGHRVVLASGPSDAPSPLLDRLRAVPGVRLVTLPSLARPIRPLTDLRAFLEIRRLLRSARFDIIHTHTSKAGALGRLAAARSGAAVVHQPHGHLFYGYRGPVLTSLIVLAERLLARRSALHIVLSWRGAEEHLGRGIGAPGAFRVVRSGIDLRPLRTAWRRRQACRARLGFGPEDLVVGTLCRLERIKGADILVEAFIDAARARPRLRLYLGGDGALREALVASARHEGLSERIVVSGAWVAPHDVLPALDLFVLASRNEGMGRALVEAMACGLPVVASDVGGMAEVLEEGRNGLLVPPSDPQALAAAIARLADDPDLARRLGRMARRRAVAFGAGRMNRRLLEVYGEVTP